MDPGKTLGDIAFTWMCEAKQQESQDEEISNVEVNQEYKAASSFSEDAAPEIHDPVLTAHWTGPNEKRGDLTLNYQEEMHFESRKLEWFIKQGYDNEENLNFFRYLVPYMKLPPTKKLFLWSLFQNMVENEISALQNN